MNQARLELAMTRNSTLPVRRRVVHSRVVTPFALEQDIEAGEFLRIAHALQVELLECLLRHPGQTLGAKNRLYSI